MKVLSQSGEGPTVVSPPVAERAEATPNVWIARFLPSLTDVAFLAPLFLTFGMFSGGYFLFGDGDTGWHLRTGEWILANGRVPRQDLFSFTKPGAPWFAWEWLWDVCFGWLHGQSGMAGVLLASLLVICLTFAVVYRMSLRASGNPLLAIAVTLAAAMASSIHYLARPHLFTWLFVVTFYWLIERAREGRTRALYWLPALTVLWTNLHGGFIAGIILLGIYAAGDLLAFVFETAEDRRVDALRRAKALTLVTLLCAVASLVNPYGYQLHVHICRYLADSYLFTHISEFTALSFQHPAARYLEVMLGIGVLSAAWSVCRHEFAHALLLLFWGHAALTVARNIPIFTLLAAPLVAACIADRVGRLRHAAVLDWLRRGVERFESLSGEVTAIERLGRIPVVSILAVVCLAGLLRAEAGVKFRAGYDPKLYPVKAVSILQDQQLHSGVFTTDIWAGYLIYRSYPVVRVFVDGRSDFYGEQLESDYLNVVNVNWRWESLLRRHQIQTILLPVDAPLAGVLKESTRWRSCYDDGVAIIFRRDFERIQATQVPAVLSGGESAVVRSRTINPVIEGSPSYARR